MHFRTTTLSIAATLSAAAAQYKGFNYGSTMTDGTAKTQSYFETEFAAAKVLAGTSGFTSARLYTSIQAGTTNTPIEAIPAAIAQGTSLLLGLWASGGQEGLTNEIAALTSAVTQYGSSFTDLVIGISVGSEDLYRTSVTGIAAMAGVGTTPDVIVNYIQQVKSALASTDLSSAKITHVDTFNAWTNSSNSAVIDAVDFLSMDAYPYFQSTMPNSIDDGLSLFQTAYDETVAAAGSKEVWVTETGWPVSGPTEGAGVPSIQNAQTYWDQVGCGFLFGKVNTFWYILQDAVPTLPSPSFGLVGVGSVDSAPQFNLTCPASASAASSSIAAVSSVTASTSSTTASGASRVPIVAVSSTPRATSSAIPSAGLAPVENASNGGIGAGAASGSAAASSVTPSATSAKPNSAAAVASSAMKTSTTSSKAAGAAATKASSASSSSTSSSTAEASSASVPVSTSGSEQSRVAGLTIAGLVSLVAVMMI